LNARNVLKLVDSVINREDDTSGQEGKEGLSFTTASGGSDRWKPNGGYICVVVRSTKRYAVT
jgi:hypothetical protein